MLIVITSPDAIAPNGIPNQDLVQVLIDTKAQGNPVGLISNGKGPGWFQNHFGESEVEFLQVKGRQNGEVISNIASGFSLNPHDVLVLAAKPEDVQMSKNGGALLIGAGWSTDEKVQSLGVLVKNATELKEVINLIAGWPGEWWVTGSEPRYNIKVLADLSGYGVTNTQAVFAAKLTEVVKHGGSKLNALLAVTARSLLTDGLGTKKDLLWGVYPSSSSTNDDTEILSDFTHRLRTTVSRVKLCKKGEPLFVRHIPSPKRSTGGGGDRTDPSGQIETIHLNPYYRDKERLLNKHVVVVDDCTTYGVSFAVAAAFLRKAGAASVTGVALGKFGNRLSYYEIDIVTNPFSPVAVGGYTRIDRTPFPITTSSTSQRTLQTLIP